MELADDLYINALGNLVSLEFEVRAIREALIKGLFIKELDYIYFI